MVSEKFLGAIGEMAKAEARVKARRAEAKGAVAKAVAAKAAWRKARDLAETAKVTSKILAGEAKLAVAAASAEKKALAVVKSALAEVKAPEVEVSAPERAPGTASSEAEVRAQRKALKEVVAKATAAKAEWHEARKLANTAKVTFHTLVSEAKHAAAATKDPAVTMPVPEARPFVTTFAAGTEVFPC